MGWQEVTLAIGPCWEEVGSWSAGQGGVSTPQDNPLLPWSCLVYHLSSFSSLIGPDQWFGMF